MTNVPTYSSTTGQTGEYLLLPPWSYALRLGWWVVYLATVVLFVLVVGRQIGSLGSLDPGGLLINLDAAVTLGLSPGVLSDYLLLLNSLSGLAYLSAAFSQALRS